MDKVYIITGGNKGLGEAFVDYVLEQPNTIVISVSRKMNSKQTDYLNTGRFVFINQDLSAKIDYTAFKKLDYVINNQLEITFISNAGTINPLNEVSRLDDQDIIEAVNINVISPVLIVKYLLQHFKANKINFINITSGAANKSIPNWSVYSSSKAFTNRFFEILSEENKDNKNFNFKSIDPGLIDTEMQLTIRSSDFPLQHVFNEAKQSGALATPAEAVKRIFKAFQTK